MELIPEVQDVFEIFSSHGYEINLVGGCIRNFLLSKPIKDYDMCTNASPEEVIALFSRTLPLGIDYGTVHVFVNGKEFEITTYRKEGNYIDHRRPDKVVFVEDIKTDLARRDFTINAMAYNEKDGIIDLFHGRKDIENKIIRTVGDPNVRFQEDAIRMLRAIRFACTLDFTIEEDTLKAIQENKEELLKISCDRIRLELNQIILSNHMEKGIDYLKSTGIWDIIFQKYLQHILQEPLPKNLDTFALLSEEEKLKYFFVILFYNDQEIEERMILASQFFAEYNYPKSIVKDVLEIMKQIALLPLDLNEYDGKFVCRLIKKLQNVFDIFLNCGKEIFANTSKQFIFDTIEKYYCKLDKENMIKSRNELAVHGKDLLEIGFPHNSAISIALDELVELVMENPSLNEREYLLEYLKNKGIESFIQRDRYFQTKNNAKERLKTEVILHKRLQDENEDLEERLKQLIKE